MSFKYPSAVVGVMLTTVYSIPLLAQNTEEQDPYRKYMPKAYIQKHEEALESRSNDMPPMALAMALSSGESTDSGAEDPKRRHIVGRGFYTYDNIPAFQSALDLNSYQVYVNKPSSELSYTLSFDTQKIASELGYGANASVPIEGVNLVAENSFLNQFESNSKTTSIIYSFSYKYRYAITQADQGPVMMSDPALSLYESDPESFISTYGDRFVSQADVGGAIFIMIKVSFTSVKDKLAFEQKVGAELPGVASVGAYIKGSLDYDDTNGKVQMYALQVGGKPLELGKIIGTDGSNYYNFADVNALDDKLRAANDYIQNFAEQIDPNDAQTSVVLGSPSTMSYTSLGNIPQGDYLPEQPFNESVSDARKKLEEGYEHYLSIRDRGIAVARQVKTRAGQLIYGEDAEKLTNLINYYTSLESFYKDAENTAQQYCYLPGEEEKYCIVAADNLADLVYDAGFESQHQLEQVAADFGYTINIDDTLFAYPITSTTPIIDMMNKIPRSNLIEDDRGFGQIYALFNADGRYIGGASLLVSQYDIDLVGPSLPETWSLYTLANKRFDQFAFSGGYINMQWLNDTDRDGFGTTMLSADVSAPGLFVGINRLDGKRFKGVNYGDTAFKFGGKRSPAVLISDLFRSSQIFRFDHADTLSYGMPESRYCYHNGGNTAWLINERTGESDGGPIYSTQCVTARPGDVISWTVYWFLYDYAITKQWTISSPDNRHTHEVSYTTFGAGAVPAGNALPSDIGNGTITVDAQL
ncbi:Uncharacterised protein [BD1-7 clade bacterium]|uniref:Uncharacterized protein n=1 Tax=BD1-7 clade bacterium TaxID=2029982 RepID=A0A5S9QMR1_9GAMM|nr:Uncharacterised protein [BD1-7 clade bacterium]